MSNETLTDFLRETKRVLARVDKEDIVLNRRGKPAIRISLESRNSGAERGMELAAHLLADALTEVPNVLPPLLERRFSWVRFLPQEMRQQFTREFVATLEACASVGNAAALSELVHAWKSTASIYADPVLAAALKTPLRETKRRVRRP